MRSCCASSLINPVSLFLENPSANSRHLEFSQLGTNKTTSFKRKKLYRLLTNLPKHKPRIYIKIKSITPLNSCFFLEPSSMNTVEERGKGKQAQGEKTFSMFLTLGLFCTQWCKEERSMDRGQPWSYLFPYRSILESVRGFLCCSSPPQSPCFPEEYFKQQ